MASLSEKGRRNGSPRLDGFRNVVVIGSRKSELALKQTYHVKQLLEEVHEGKGITFVVKTSSTVGDDFLDVPLATLARKESGIFAKTLEIGLESGVYDFAVHSLKDMPTTLPQNLKLSAILEREDPSDSLVVHNHFAGKCRVEGLKALPDGAVVGTSSVRRCAIIKRHFPKLHVRSIRGNLNTRLKKLDDSLPFPERKAVSTGLSENAVQQHYDAIILATSGLKRMGWENRIEQLLPETLFPYAAGQGSLGIESRNSDKWIQSLLDAIIHPPSAFRCLAERSFLAGLQGGCQMPVGCSSSFDCESKVLHIAGYIFKHDGTKVIEASGTSVVNSLKEAAALGDKLATSVIGKGGSSLMQENEEVMSEAEQVTRVPLPAALRRPLTYSTVATDKKG